MYETEKIIETALCYEHYKSEAINLKLRSYKSYNAWRITKLMNTMIQYGKFILVNEDYKIEFCCSHAFFSIFYNIRCDTSTYIFYFFNTWFLNDSIT